MTFILLLRGINVGGRTVPMADLRAMLADLGAQEVRTYIQSGNAVFEAGQDRARAIADTLPKAIEEQFGFTPDIVVLDAQGLARLAAANPFPDCARDPKTLHLYLLTGTPDKDAKARLQALAAPTERFELAEGCLYICAPDGIARSKLVARVERALGVPATGRNWRTVTRLLDMAGLQT